MPPITTWATIHAPTPTASGSNARRRKLTSNSNPMPNVTTAKIRKASSRALTSVYDAP